MGWLLHHHYLFFLFSDLRNLHSYTSHLVLLSFTLVTQKLLRILCLLFSWYLVSIIGSTTSAACNKDLHLGFWIAVHNWDKKIRAHSGPFVKPHSSLEFCCLSTHCSYVHFLPLHMSIWVAFFLNICQIKRLNIPIVGFILSFSNEGQTML